MNTFEWIRESNLIEGVDDPQEDARCERVWKILLETRQLSIMTIKMIHFGIMNELRPDIAGRLRVVNVQVGGHVCPNWRTVEHSLKTWVDTFRQAGAHLTIVGATHAGEEIRVAHVEFEKIHPFEDGNGRTGRMLMNWQRVRAGLAPLLIKASERQAYYEWFRD